ncbi:hypothetical protein AB0I06_26520 [Streptomyces sp. NPDC050674]|uniref:hypothetical protein n=1 Tax=Streptomyces sp. NPDC050674 TaxID=3157216 RepID=UPI00344A82AE
MPDPRIQTAYESAYRALRYQNEELSRTHSRAIAVFAVSVLSTTLFIGLGLLRIQGGSSGGRTLPTWSAWPLLGLMVAIGLVALIITLPSKQWQDGANVDVILDRQRLGVDDNQVHISTAEDLGRSYQVNKGILEARGNLLRVSIFLLIVSVVIALISFTL